MKYKEKKKIRDKGVIIIILSFFAGSIWGAWTYSSVGFLKLIITIIITFCLLICLNRLTGLIYNDIQNRKEVKQNAK